MLHEKTVKAIVSLHGCVSIGTPFGKFKSDRGRPKSITDLKAIAYYLTVPKFKVVQKDAEGNTLSDTEVERKPRAIAPIKVSKLRETDGWREMDLQDPAREEYQAKLNRTASEQEAAWLQEEQEKERDRKAENQALKDASDPKDTSSASEPDGIHDEVFSPRWTAKMGAPRLQEIYEGRTGEKLDEKLSKRKLIGLLNGLDQEEEG